MRKLVVLLALCVGCATLPVEQITQQDVIDLPGMSKKQIFDKSKLWLASSFRSYKNVAQYEDFAEGKIIGNGSASWYWMRYLDTMTLLARIEIDAKDGKARMTAAPLSLTFQQGPITHIIDSDRVIIEEQLGKFKASYVSFMSAKKADNW